MKPRQSDHARIAVCACAAGLAIAFSACEPYPTRPTNRRPTISAVTAFPATLDTGESTLVTVTATDPDGDTLVYDWDSYNGLVTKAGSTERTSVYHTSNSRRVFYLRWRPQNYDTAFISCYVRDVKGGGASRRIIIVLRDSSSNAGAAAASPVSAPVRARPAAARHLSTRTP